MRFHFADTFAHFGNLIRGGGDEILMRLDEIWFFIIFPSIRTIVGEIPAFLMIFVFVFQFSVA